LGEANSIYTRHPSRSIIGTLEGFSCRLLGVVAALNIRHTQQGRHLYEISNAEGTSWPKRP